MEQVKGSNWAKRQAFRRGLRVAAALLAWAVASPALGAPLLDSRVGGLALVGPSSQHLASAYYNPATLSMSPGLHLLLDGTARLGLGSYQRRRVDTRTGAPGAGLLEAQDYLEAFPQLFLGVATDMGSRNVVISLFACTPVAHHISLRQGGELNAGDLAPLRPRDPEAREALLDELFDPRVQGPARYNLVDLTLYHMNLTIAASYRIIKELSLGLSMSYVFGSLDLAFVRDAALEGGSKLDVGEVVALDACGGAGACNHENPAAAEAIRTRGQSHGIAFAAGVLVQPHDRVDVGLGYISEVVGVGGDDIPTKGDAWVLRSQAAIDTVQRAGDAIYRDMQGRSTVTYRLPHQLHLGVTWRPSSRLLFNGQVRWQHLSTLEQFTIQLTGAEFREQPRMPDRISLYRGHQDVFAFQLGGGYLLLESLGVQTGVMLETAAVPRSALNMGTIDAVKVDLFLGLHWRVYRGLSLRLGYGVALMPGVDVENSDFSPAHMVDCVDNRYTVDLEACQAAARGQGTPSAAGQYTLTMHRVGLGIAYDVF